LVQPLSRLMLMLAEGDEPRSYGWVLVQPLSRLMLMSTEGDEPRSYGWARVPA
jgi:hypothetical protein